MRGEDMRGMFYGPQGAGVFKDIHESDVARRYNKMFVRTEKMAVAFSLFPTSMEALMAVADANEVMPPKSTWFEPKLADGLVSHVLD